MHLFKERQCTQRVCECVCVCLTVLKYVRCVRNRWKFNQTVSGGVVFISSELVAACAPPGWCHLFVRVCGCFTLVQCGCIVFKNHNCQSRSCMRSVVPFSGVGGRVERGFVERLAIICLIKQGRATIPQPSVATHRLAIELLAFNKNRRKKRLNEPTATATTFKKLGWVHRWSRTSSPGARTRDTNSYLSWVQTHSHQL